MATFELSPGPAFMEEVDSSPLWPAPLELVGNKSDHLPPESKETEEKWRLLKTLGSAAAVLFTGDPEPIWRNPRSSA